MDAPSFPPRARFDANHIPAKPPPPETSPLPFSPSLPLHPVSTFSAVAPKTAAICRRVALPPGTRQGCENHSDGREACLTRTDTHKTGAFE